jgi:hypothetical protein
MKKILILIIFIGNLFGFNGCVKKITISKDLIKKEIYLNGKKVILYQDPNEKAVVKGNKVKILNNTSNGYLVFYTSRTKSPYTRLIATEKIIVYLDRYTPEEIEKKYNIKFIKYINKDLKMALFKGNKENILNTVNNLNENKIKASIDFIRKFKLY